MRRRQFTAALAVLPFTGRAFAQGDDWPQRTVRIVDGPDEVHRNAIAKIELAKRAMRRSA